MKYLGGKAKLAKHLAPFLIRSLKSKNGVFYEPFVGGFNIVPHINEHIDNGLCVDINKSLVNLYKAIQNGWEPPSKVSETMYRKYKKLKNCNDPLTAFISIGCSFGGKEWGGYARDGKGVRNYALEAKNSLLNKKLFIGNVIFSHGSYKDYCPKNSTIYCDPPYINTTGYKTETFNHKDFFKWCEQAADNGCDVFISEAKKPRGKHFKTIWHKDRKVSVSGMKNTKILKELLIKVVL